MFSVRLTRATASDALWNSSLEATYWWTRCWNDKGFIDQIVRFKNFELTSHSSEAIALSILETRVNLPADETDFTCRTPYQVSHLLKFTFSKRHRVAMNAEVYAHNTLHCLDYWHRNGIFDKETPNTVPYAIARLTREWILEHYFVSGFYTEGLFTSYNGRQRNPLLESEYLFPMTGAHKESK